MERQIINSDAVKAQANDLIRHIERTSDPKECAYTVIGCLAVQDYEANKALIQELLYYSYDLMGM